MKQTLKLGVVGCGARSALLDYVQEPESSSRITACCDTNPAQLDKCRRRYGEDVFTCTQLDELLSVELDGVFVLTPGHLHSEHAIACLQAGVPTFLEKPMAITIEQCDGILSAAQSTGTKLFIGHNLRYMNLFRKMKQLIEQGHIGRVRSVWYRHFISYGGDAYFRDWHAERRYITSLLLEKACHDLDIIHWLAGGYTQRVSALGNLAVYGNQPKLPDDQQGFVDWTCDHWPPTTQVDFNPRMDVEDQSVLILQLPDHILGTYAQCHFTPDAYRNCTVIGDEGRLENIGDEPTSPIYLYNRRSDAYRIEGDEAFYGDQTETGGHGGADPLIVKDFLEYLRSGRQPRGASPLTARMAVATACQATRSLRQQGMPQDIPPTPAT